MNCPRHDDISAYIDSAMALAERENFARHLDSCPVCRERHRALSALQIDLRNLPSPALGFDLAAQFHRPIRTTEVPRRPRRHAWLGWQLGGLTIALSLVGGVWLGGLLVGSGINATRMDTVTRVFDPVPPGGLCTAHELCRISKGSQ